MELFSRENSSGQDGVSILSEKVRGSSQNMLYSQKGVWQTKDFKPGLMSQKNAWDIQPFAILAPVLLLIFYVFFSPPFKKSFRNLFFLLDWNPRVLWDLGSHSHHTSMCYLTLSLYSSNVPSMLSFIRKLQIFISLLYFGNYEGNHSIIKGPTFLCVQTCCQVCSIFHFFFSGLVFI